MFRQLSCSLAAALIFVLSVADVHAQPSADPAKAGIRLPEPARPDLPSLNPRGEPQETAPTNLAGATLNVQLVVMGLMKQEVLPDSFYTQRFESH